MSVISARHVSLIALRLKIKYQSPTTIINNMNVSETIIAACIMYNYKIVRENPIYASHIMQYIKNSKDSSYINKWWLII